MVRWGISREIEQKGLAYIPTPQIAVRPFPDLRSGIRLKHDPLCGVPFAAVSNGCSTMIGVCTCARVEKSHGISIRELHPSPTPARLAGQALVTVGDTCGILPEFKGISIGGGVAQWIRHSRVQILVRAATFSHTVDKSVFFSRDQCNYHNIFF